MNKPLLTACLALLAACGGPELDTHSSELKRPIEDTHPGECTLACAAPPAGCHYEGGVWSGPCEKLTCGDLVCATDSAETVEPQECAIRCAAPPKGCEYHGAVLSGPCEQLTCGTLVCDIWVPSEPTCAIKCAAPPKGCEYQGAVLSGPCEKLTCGTLVCAADA